MTQLTLKQLADKLVSDVRFSEYAIYEKLFNGDHFGAFAIKSENFKTEYSRLRYVVANFAGLVSKVIADMLFGEAVTVTDEENQDVIDALVFENKLDTLYYESSIANSYFGDNLFKIRVDNNKIIIEDTPPMFYVPELDPGNARAEPKRIHLVWYHEVNKDERYILDEVHEPPFVKMNIGLVGKDGITPVDVATFNTKAGTNYVDSVDTGVKRFLVKYVPNWKARGHFGISDFIDLKPLLFALNNRLSKTDNILDKHSDPILAVPEGVLNDDGDVKKESFNMFEMDEEGHKPEYIVWNANLDSAFKQIDKLVEFLFMFSETSPDAMGLGNGTAAESGRALKMRLLRTIAKRNRKKLYYDQAIKDLIFTVELLMKAHPEYYIGEDFKDLEVTTPNIPKLGWQDGVVNDEVERTDIMIKKVDAGLMPKVEAIMELEGVDRDEAEKMSKEIDDAKADFTSIFDPKNPNGNSDQKLDENGKPITDANGNDQGNNNQDQPE